MNLREFKILKLLQQRMPKQQAIQYYTRNFNFHLAEAKKLVGILSGSGRFADYRKKTEPVTSGLNDICQNISWYSSKYYTFRQTHFCFNFETPCFEALIHPKLSHIESEPYANAHHYSIFRNGNKLVLADGARMLGSWEWERVHFATGRIYMEILNKTYQKTDEGWLAVLHASAVSNGKTCLLFPGDSGCGKSTLAALLIAFGYTLVADDYVPVEADKSFIMDCPSVVSVKDSAFEILTPFFPGFNSAPEFSYPGKNKTIRFLTGNQAIKIPADGLPAKAIIFVRYVKDSGFLLQKIPQCRAFKKLIPDTWIPPLAFNVSRFLDWFSCIPCYQITYSDNIRIITEIEKIFSDEL